MTEIVEDLTGNDFATISDEDLDEAIQSFALVDRQRLGQSMFCYVWAILTHPTTKLVSSCATIQNFDENVRLSLEIFVMQNLYVDYWCSKWQDPMWAKDEQGGPLHRLYVLVQKDRDEIDRRLVSQSCGNFSTCLSVLDYILVGAHSRSYIWASTEYIKRPGVHIL